MSWGIKISILYTGFVLLIVSMVAMTMRENEDLVSTDYYEQEIKYQQKIDRINRTAALKESLLWKVSHGSIELKFPEQFKGEKITGNIYFFRPSDASLDKTIELTQDTLSVRSISTGRLKKGLYKIEVSWKADKEEYYNEGIVQIK